MGEIRVLYINLELIIKCLGYDYWSGVMNDNGGRSFCDLGK